VSSVGAAGKITQNFYRWKIDANPMTISWKLQQTLYKSAF